MCACLMSLLIMRSGVCLFYLKKRLHGIVYSPFVRSKLDLCNILRCCTAASVTSLKYTHNSSSKEPGSMQRMDGHKGNSACVHSQCCKTVVQLPLNDNEVRPKLY